MFSIDIYDENFLKEIFAVTDANSLPETPPNYPPFFSWDKTAGFEVDKISNIWKKSNKENFDRNPTIYVHVPFCEYICKFCGFYRKIPKNNIEINKYLKALEKEVLFLKKTFKNLPIRNLFIGGGTPTILSEDELEFMFGIFKDNFNITKNTRIAIESSPQTLTYPKAKKLKKLGVGFLSMGIQSFNEQLMRSFNRPQTMSQCVNALKNAKKAGIKNVEADLMVGLPGQTEKIFMKDVDILSKFDLERVYIFDWQPKEFTGFKNFHGASLGLSDLRKAREWRKKAIDLLVKRQGYTTESGHWMSKRKGGEWPYTYDQQENEGYSILGLGPTGMSYCAGGQRYQNISSVSKYVSLIEKNKLPIAIIHFPSKRDEMVNYALLKYIHTGSLVINRFKKKFKKNPEDVFKKEFDYLCKKDIILKAGSSYALKDRTRAIFFLKAVFYSPELIKKLARRAKIKIEYKNSGSAKKSISEKVSDSRNLKIIYLGKNFKRELIGLEGLKSEKRDFKDIAAELKSKNSKGLNEIIFMDGDFIEYEKACFLINIAGKIGYKKVSFFTSGLTGASAEKFKKLKKYGIDKFYLNMPDFQDNGFSNKDMKVKNAFWAKKAGLNLVMTAILNEKEFGNIEKRFSLAKKLGAEEFLYVLPSGYKNHNTAALYEKLKKNAKKINAAASRKKIKVKILNSLPCFLQSYNEFFENFLFVSDAREEGDLIKIEVCLKCKYSSHCPGPREEYLKELKHFDIKPIKV